MMVRNDWLSNLCTVAFVDTETHSLSLYCLLTNSDISSREDLAPAQPEMDETASRGREKKIHKAIP